jgi:hypothetical protein
MCRCDFRLPRTETKSTIFYLTIIGIDPTAFIKSTELLTGRIGQYSQASYREKDISPSKTRRFLSILFL